MQSKHIGEHVSIIGIPHTSYPTSAKEISKHLEDPSVEDIRHRQFLGGTAYPEMLDVSDAVLRKEKGLTLMGLFKVTRTLGSIQEGTVIRLDQKVETPPTQGLATFVLTVDSGEGAVVYKHPNFTGCIADKLVAAEGISRMLRGDQMVSCPNLGSLVIYPDNHVA